jgi:hypothetical protein
MHRQIEDREILEWLRTRCATLPEAEEGGLQGRPLFHVRRRRFAIFNADSSPDRPRWNGCGQSLHVLTEVTEREALRQDDRFFVSPHHGENGWLAFRFSSSRVDWDELGELVEAGYRQAAPRSLCDRLDAIQDPL